MPLAPFIPSEDATILPPTLRDAKLDRGSESKMFGGASQIVSMIRIKCNGK